MEIHATRQGKKQGRIEKEHANYYLDNLLLEKLKKAKETTIRTNKVAACKECKSGIQNIYSTCYNM